MTSSRGPNVAFDPVIPVVTKDGDVTAVGLRDALVGSPRLRALAVQPLALGPVVRVLVALVLRTHAVRDADAIRNLWEQASFDEAAIDRYFAENLERFFLFDEQNPFLQVASLNTGAGPRPVTALELHVASGNNVPLFSSYTDDNRPIADVTSAFCNMLATLNYDPAGLKGAALDDVQAKGGKSAGNQTGHLGKMGAIIPLGESLFDTLLLNTPVGRVSADDKPAWERDFDANWQVRTPDGVLDLLTFPSRRLRLFPSGDKLAVEAVVVTSGDRMPFVPRDLEPHCRWRQNKVRSGPEWTPMRWQSGRPAWRGLDSLLALRDSDGQQTSNLLMQLGELSEWLDPSYPLRLACVGVIYGNMSAVVEDVYVDELPLPLAAMRASQGIEMREALTEVVGQADAVRRALNDLSNNLRVIQGGEKIGWDKGHHPGDDALVQMTEPTFRLLAGLQGEPEKLQEGLLAWETDIERIAWSVANPLLDQALPAAFEGRSVSFGSGERMVRLADVEAWFRFALSKALTHLTTSRTKESE